MIVHMTTVHYRDDSRIRDKQCASLKKEMPVPVFMLVQDGKPDEVFGPHQLPIVNTGPDLPRLKRMSRGAFGMIRHVLALKPKIVFFHDPELLPWAMLLKFFGIKVVYDAH
ncbi:MAG: group 1 glycosyl transferase, partial [Pseudomonadota bacterium]